MNDALALHIGKRLRKRRRLLELSQAALGANCGVSFQTIHKYEAGAVRISAAALFALAEALEVPTSYFFEEFDQPYDPANDAPPPQATVADRGRGEALRLGLSGAADGQDGGAGEAAFAQVVQGPVGLR